MKPREERGIDFMVAREDLCPGALKMRDIYAITPGVPFHRREFGFFCLERWYEQGLPRDADLAEYFQYDPPGEYMLGQLGWCEAAFMPAFEVKVIEDRGAHEVEQDHAGRQVLYFKGRRSGFMPEYIGHPVRDRQSWEADVQWRLDPARPERYTDLEARMAQAQAQAAQGMMIVQNIIGAYMYLRSLMGPSELLYRFCEDPELIHACMEAWLALADAITARHQAYVTFDVLFFGEDICYNGGLLISPGMVGEFLMPYYQQLLANVKARQRDRTRHLYVHIDTDGDARPAIPVYRDGLGMDVMSPFEVASGCDVVAIAQEEPDLVLFGGIDKRILASSPAAIDRELERILPPLRERGGYTPTCDHGVPEEVPLENYLHYRRRCIELGG